MEFGDDIWFKDMEKGKSKYGKYIMKVFIALVFLGFCYYFFQRHIKYSKGYYRFLATINKIIPWKKKEEEGELNEETYFANDEYYPFSVKTGDNGGKIPTKFFVMFTGEKCPISESKKRYIYGDNKRAKKIRELFKKENIILKNPWKGDVADPARYRKGTGSYYAMKFQRYYNTKIKGYPSLYLLDVRNKKAYEYNAKINVENMKAFLMLTNVD